MSTSTTFEEQRLGQEKISCNKLKEAFSAALFAFDNKPNQANFANLLNAIKVWADARRPKPDWITSNNGKTNVLMLDGEEIARVESKTVYSHLYIRGEKTSQLFRSRANALSAGADVWMEAQYEAMQKKIVPGDFQEIPLGPPELGPQIEFVFEGNPDDLTRHQFVAPLLGA